MLSLRHWLLSFTHLGEGHAVVTTLTANFHTCWGRTCCCYDNMLSRTHLGWDMLSLLLWMLCFTHMGWDMLSVRHWLLSFTHVGWDMLSLPHYLPSFTHVGEGHAVVTTLAAQFHTCWGRTCCRYDITCWVSHMWGGTCCRYDISSSVSHMLG